MSASNDNIFEILASLREAIARLDERLQKVPDDVEFTEFRLGLKNEISSINNDIERLKFGQSKCKRQISLVKLYLNSERRKSVKKALDKSNADKKEIKDGKKGRKKFWLEIIKGAIIAAITAALTLILS